MCARYCLVDQAPEIGILNYRPDEFVLPVQGFKQIERNGDKLAVMTDSVAYLVINNEEKQKTIRLPFIVDESLKKGNFVVNVSVFVGDERMSSCALNDEFTLEVDISVPAEKYVHLKIVVNNIPGFSVIKQTTDSNSVEDIKQHCLDGEQIRRTRMADEDTGENIGICINLDQIQLF